MIEFEPGERVELLFPTTPRFSSESGEFRAMDDRPFKIKMGTRLTVLGRSKVSEWWVSTDISHLGLTDSNGNLIRELEIFCTALARIPALKQLAEAAE